MSIKSKRKMRNWRCQRHLTAKIEGLVSDSHKGIEEINVPIKSVITGAWMDKGDALRDWQEFVFMRQEKVEKKLQCDDFSSEYTTIMERVDQLLEGHPAKVSEAVTELIVTVTYMHYNKGFFDGMKVGTVMGSL